MSTLLHRNSDPGDRPRSEKFYKFLQRKKDERYNIGITTAKRNEEIKQESHITVESAPFHIPREDSDVSGNYRKFYKALQQKKDERNAYLKNCQKGIDLIKQGDSCTVATTSTHHSFEKSDDPSISIDSFDDSHSDFEFMSGITRSGSSSNSFFSSGDVAEMYDEEASEVSTSKDRDYFRRDVNEARHLRKGKRVVLQKRIQDAETKVVLHKRIQVATKKDAVVSKNKSLSPTPKDGAKVEEVNDENKVTKDLVLSREKNRHRQGEIREKLAKKLTRLRSLEHKGKVARQHIQKQIAMIEKASSDNACELSEVLPSDDEVEVTIISPSSTVSSLSPWKE